MNIKEVSKTGAKWRRGFEQKFHADAEKVAEEIMAIGDNVTPQQIVDAARDENSELHKCFTWDDNVAAEKWRKHEARNLTYFLVIESDKREEEKPEIRVFHMAENGAGYNVAPKVFKIDDEYKKLLQRAYAELRAFKVKYASLKELDYILSLIE